MFCTFGEKRQTSVTLALSEMVTAMLVTRSGTCDAVPKYSGTKASQITHVVYIVKPLWDGKIGTFIVGTSKQNAI